MYPSLLNFNLKTKARHHSALSWRTPLIRVWLCSTTFRSGCFVSSRRGGSHRFRAFRGNQSSTCFSNVLPRASCSLWVSRCSPPGFSWCAPAKADALTGSDDQVIFNRARAGEALSSEQGEDLSAPRCTATCRRDGCWLGPRYGVQTEEF